MLFIVMITAKGYSDRIELDLNDRKILLYLFVLPDSLLKRTSILLCSNNNLEIICCTSYSGFPLTLADSKFYERAEERDHIG